MEFHVVGTVTDIETIATGRSIRELPRLRKAYGPGRWRKLKSTGLIRLPDGSTCRAELHWYEAHGIGKKEMKIKHILR
jgi:hypothetical protein